MEAKLNIYQRMHAVMMEVEYVQKEKKAGMQYSTVSHDAVTAKVRPALVKHRVVYHPHSITRVQDGNKTMIDMVLRFVNIDNPEDYIDVPSIGDGIDNQDKGPGKAVSYAVKYALLKALGLETGDDPDLDQHAKHEPAPKKVITKSTLSVEEPISEAQLDHIYELIGMEKFEANEPKLRQLSRDKAIAYIAKLEKETGHQEVVLSEKPRSLDEKIENFKGRGKQPELVKVADGEIDLSNFDLGEN